VAAKFAVGDDRKPVFFLPLNDVANRFVLGLSQLFSGCLAAVVAREDLSQFRRAHQAADMIDANPVKSGC